MADQEEEDCEFETAFKDGESMGIDLVKEMIKKFTKEFPGKKGVHDRLYYFSGITAGYISAVLFHSYMEISRLIEEDGGKGELADFWCQKVVTTFGQAVADEKIPVNLQFMIRRGK